MAETERFYPDPEPQQLRRSPRFGSYPAPPPLHRPALGWWPAEPEPWPAQGCRLGQMGRLYPAPPPLRQPSAGWWLAEPDPEPWPGHLLAPTPALAPIVAAVDLLASTGAGR